MITINIVSVVMVLFGSLGFWIAGWQKKDYLIGIIYWLFAVGLDLFSVINIIIIVKELHQ